MGWFSGGWNDAVAGHPDPLFQFNHQPFAYFAKYGQGTPGQAAHLHDEQDFLRAVHDNTLPAVAFVKPDGADDTIYRSGRSTAAARSRTSSRRPAPTRTTARSTRR